MNRKAITGSIMALVAAASLAQGQTFIGSFETDDGPNWSTNPAVLSGVEAAALIFGGDASDYRISTNSSLDPLSITDTAWYTTIGIADGQEYAANFSQDLGGAGYGAAGWVAGDDISTYVDDNAFGALYTNYVWAVPTPGAAAIFGLAGFAGLRRRR